ncbi:hypothetical protein ACEPAI_2455 [Sanghuangporus weigelae]
MVLARAFTLPALDSTFGCLFLAGIFSTALWGVGCLQLYQYYDRFAKTDKRWLTMYIFAIWTIDTAHQVILVDSLYMYFVKEFGNLLYLAQPQKLLLFVALLTGITDAMVQSIFIMRAWYLSQRNLKLIGALSIAALAQLALNVAYFGQMYNLTSFAQLPGILNTERALNVVVLFTDTFIAIVLIVLLWKLRSGTKKTDTVVKRLVIYTISTGLVTSLWAVVALIGTEVKPDSFIYVLVDLVFPKLYFNCMLASLNERANHRKELESVEADKFDGSGSASDTAASSPV